MDENYVNSSPSHLPMTANVVGLKVRAIATNRLAVSSWASRPKTSSTDIYMWQMIGLLR